MRRRETIYNLFQFLPARRGQPGAPFHLFWQNLQNFLLFSAFFSFARRKLVLVGRERERATVREGSCGARELPSSRRCFFVKFAAGFAPHLFTRRKRRNGQRETRDALKTVEEEEVEEVAEEELKKKSKKSKKKKKKSKKKNSK